MLKHVVRAGVVAVLVAGCSTAAEPPGQTDEMRSDPVAVDRPSRQPDSSPTVEPVDDAEVVDWAASQRDVQFWSAPQHIGTDPVEGYKTLEEMTQAATAVVIGQVVDTGERVIAPDPAVPEDQVTLQTTELLVTDVLAGQLPVATDANQGRHVTVEGLHRPTDAIATSAPVVIFLRWKGEGADNLDLSHLSDEERQAVQTVFEQDRQAYRTVSRQGVMLEVDGGVVLPRAERPAADGDEQGDEPEQSLADVSPIAATVEGLPMQQVLDMITEAAS